MRYKFCLLPTNEAEALVIRWHYLNRSCSVSWAWGIRDEDEDNQTVGVLTIGTNASATMRASAVGETLIESRSPYSLTCHVYELNRLWVADHVTKKNIESRFIGWCLREMKRIDPYAVVVSYADSSQGHVGYVYQATNFSYTGLTAKFKDKTSEGVIARTLKHRYVWFADAEMRSLMKWPVLPYPKTAAVP